MSGYRPICDVWLLARSKVKYYGAYPAGFLARARTLLGAALDDPVLHVCSGKVRDYPFAGFGPHDATLDLDPETDPTFVHDARQPYPMQGRGLLALPWRAVLADPPYTPDDAAHYTVGADVLPTARIILAHALNVVAVGGRVGILHYSAPRPDKATAKFVACVAVVVGYENKVRLFSVYERLK